MLQSCFHTLASTMPDKCKNGGFTLKTHQVLFFHITPERFDTQQPSIILDLCCNKTRAGESHNYCNAIFRKASLLKCNPLSP